jgi:hypothetical protein
MSSVFRVEAKNHIVHGHPSTAPTQRSVCNFVQDTLYQYSTVLLQGIVSVCRYLSSRRIIFHSKSGLSKISPETTNFIHFGSFLTAKTMLSYPGLEHNKLLIASIAIFFNCCRLLIIAILLQISLIIAILLQISLIIAIQLQQLDFIAIIVIQYILYIYILLQAQL